LTIWLAIETLFDKDNNMQSPRVLDYTSATQEFPSIAEVLKHVYHPPKKVVVIEGNIKISAFDDAYIAKFTGPRGFMLVRGDVHADHLRLNGDDHDACGLLVIGSVWADRVRLGNPEILIEGNLTVKDYIFSARPPYECGKLEVHGVTHVPAVIQTDCNPILYLNLADIHNTVQVSDEDVHELERKVRTARALLTIESDRTNKIDEILDGRDLLDEWRDMDDVEKAEIEALKNYSTIFYEGVVDDVDLLIEYLRQK
jgi:hypothetical protein